MQLVRYYQRLLEEFLDRHRGILIFLSALFVMGVIFGALAVRSLEGQDKLDLVKYVRSAVPGLASPPEGAGLLMLKKALWGRLKLLALLWVLGISVAGIFGVMAVVLLRGLLSGFVMGLLAAQLGSAGLLLAVAGHLPQSFLEVPAVLLAGTASVAFSLQVVRSWRERRRVPHFYPALAAYTGTLLAMGLVMVLACVVESYVSPVFVRFAASFLHAP